jgi:D-alanyl-D-alanine carboxypeptidase
MPRRTVAVAALVLALASVAACSTTEASQPDGDTVVARANDIATGGASSSDTSPGGESTVGESTDGGARTTVAATPPPVTVPEEPFGPAPSQPPMVDGSFPPYAPTTAVAVARPEPDGGAFAAFDDSLQHSLFGHGVLTASVAVAKDGVIVHRQAFGSADPYTADPVRLASTFRIASISKMLLAVAIMRLVERGTLSLDAAPLSSLASSLGTTMGDPRMANVTLRQLMGHVSGFPEYERTFFGGLVDTCRDAAIRGISRKLGSDPGTAYNYSNMNYCILGLIVEQTTGRPYDAVVQDEVLTPLGIGDMRAAGTFDTRPGDVLHPTTQTRKFMEALGAAGSWLGTPADLVTIVDSLDPNKPLPHLLSPASVATMQARPPVTFSRPEVWYGLGLIMWDNGAGYGHTGTLENARSMVFHRPDGITWAVLVNSNYPAASEKIRTMMDKALAQVTAWP